MLVTDDDSQIEIDDFVVFFSFSLDVTAWFLALAEPGHGKSASAKNRKFLPVFLIRFEPEGASLATPP